MIYNVAVVFLMGILFIIDSLWKYQTTGDPVALILMVIELMLCVTLIVLCVVGAVKDKKR